MFYEDKIYFSEKVKYSVKLPIVYEDKISMNSE